MKVEKGKRITKRQKLVIEIPKKQYKKKDEKRYEVNLKKKKIKKKKNLKKFLCPLWPSKMKNVMLLCYINK